MLGIEVKTKWAAKVDERRRVQGLEQIHVLCGDARDILSRAQPDACVDRVFMHFPDPWWKKRHAKRRLLDRAFVDELARLLKPDGELYIQTDVEDRAHAYLALLRDHEAFALEPGEPFIDQNPFGTLSNRERRAEQDGLPVWRILAARR